MAGESFQQLLGMDAGKHTSIEGVGLNKDIQEANDIEEHQKDVDKVRRRERGYTQKANQNMAQDKALREQFGTSDPTRIAAIKASGGLDVGDLAAGMRVDPEGTKAKFERAMSLAGKGGVQDIPDGPPERDYYRKEDNGTLAFGNTPEFAADPRSRRYNSDSGKSKDLGAPGGSFSQDRSEGAVTPQNPEDILFQGKVDQARAVVEAPEKLEKRAQDTEKYFDELWDGSPDVRGAREKLQADWFSGKAKERGLQMRDIKTLDQIILKRGKTIGQLTDPGIDKLFYKPWVKAGRPGQAADLAEPPSVLNPGGGTSETTKVKQNEAMAASDAAAGIEATMPTERTKAYDYARGAGRPTPKSTAAPQSPSATPGSHLSKLEGPNPLDPYIDSVDSILAGPRLHKGAEAESALKKRQKDADIFGIGF